MDNCGGGGQRLPPDGDEFPAAYQEFTSPSQPYQYVTTRDTMASNGDVDRGESLVDSPHHHEPTTPNKHTSPRSGDSNGYALYTSQKKIEIASYYAPKEDSDEVDEVSLAPPPLPLTGPPKAPARTPERKYSASGDLWRQDNRSEKSVKDKIAMFSSQASLEVPLFPTAPPPARRLSKHKSSDDVFADEKRPAPVERTQSTYDLGPEYATVAPPAPPARPAPALARATSFSGTTGMYGQERLQTNGDVNGVSGALIARTNSLASTFKRSSEEIRKSSLSQLIEQRRKGISKLRGLVIPEKDALPIDQPIIDLPEIKSRDSILNNQITRTNIQDKWGSQSSLASNASTVSSSVRTNGSSFKMPAPKILSSYSPAFKRKSLTVYGSTPSTTSDTSSPSTPVIGSPKNGSSNGNRLGSPASEAPKSLESICSPTRSDYSFEFLSSGGSPDGQLAPSTRPGLGKLTGAARKLGRNEYDDSDNDSAVSSSQSSISRGFSPPASPVPSDRSTISSERSYLSSEAPAYQRPQQLILGRPEKPPPPALKSPVASQIPQRQPVRRSSSTDTTSSNSSTLTTSSTQPICGGGGGGGSDSLSRRVLKPQSVEAINRKNILASARCRSGRDLNGSPLIQRKFEDEEGRPADKGENGQFVQAHRIANGLPDGAKPQIKIAYIEITENVVADNEEKPRTPPKRTIIPQAKHAPIPSSRVSKPDTLDQSSDMKSWVHSEMRSLSSNGHEQPARAIANNAYNDPRKKSTALMDEPEDAPASRGFRSKSTMSLNDSSPPESPGTRGQIHDSKTPDDNDLLTVLTTKSRSRSAIHVEDTSYGKLKSQMSLEDILAVKSETSKLPRSQSVTSDRNGVSGFPWSNGRANGSATAAHLDSPVRRSNSTDSWSEEKIFPSKIPSLSRNGAAKLIECAEEEAGVKNSKIPTARNLGRRSSSVTDMKKVFEKADMSPTSGNSSPASQLSNTVTHNRFPSLDSSVEEGIRPVGGCDAEQERFSGEQFGSISSLASSTSLISQQELAQLVEEANLEEPRGGHDVVVVLLHKENPAGSVGIALAGGVDCETKEITVHRVLSHSIADKEGSLQRGDRILSINGRSVRGLTHRESLAVLKQPRSELVLVLSRAKADEHGHQQQANGAPKLRGRTESVETIVEGYETNGVADGTAWGPPLTVSLYKDGTGLGFSLEGGRDSPLGDRPLLIKKIFTGGAAEKTGALRAGDQLLEVNKRDVSRMSRIEAWSLMKKLQDGEVNLLVRRPATKSS